MRCFHVTTDRGGRYGAAATTKRDALQMVQDRLSREDDAARALGLDTLDDRPAKAEDVGAWPDTEYGTVVCYFTWETAALKREGSPS